MDPVKNDIWRDSPLRLLGYANEVGEAFQYIFPKFYKPSYFLAIAYCFGDVQDKAIRAYKVAGFKSKVVIDAFDAMVWQMLASVVIPGFTINRVVATTRWAMMQKGSNNPGLIKWVPVIAGISIIPFIVEPIDHGTSELLNVTIRKVYY